MRAARWNRHICFLLTLMMLVTGMCFETVKADSSFSSNEFPFAVNTARFVKGGLETQDIFIEDQADSYELLNRVEETVRTRKEIKNDCSSLVFLSPEIAFKQFSASLNRMALGVRLDNFSNAVIIGYVHNQDGSKR